MHWNDFDNIQFYSIDGGIECVTYFFVISLCSLSAIFTAVEIQKHQPRWNVKYSTPVIMIEFIPFDFAWKVQCARIFYGDRHLHLQQDDKRERETEKKYRWKTEITLFEQQRQSELRDNDKKTEKNNLILLNIMCSQPIFSKYSLQNGDDVIVSNCLQFTNFLLHGWGVT